jgi:hypothetical protein
MDNDSITRIFCDADGLCHNQRMYQHRVFKGSAERGKSSTGWFYGFKPRLIINDRGELCAFFLSRGNTDDRDPGVINRLCRDLWGKFFGDRGYISQEIFEWLYRRGIKLITRLGKHMKNKLPDMEEKLLLRKRGAIELVNDFLKNICQVEHSRHRSPVNFPVNLFGAMSAYIFLPHKPSIRGVYANLMLPMLA